MIEGTVSRLRAGRRAFITGGAAAVFARVLAADPVFAQATPQAGVTRLRYAHSLPTATIWQTWGVAFKTEVEKISGGQIQVTIYPNAQMGDENATSSAVRLGALEMGAGGTGLMTWVPEVSVTDAPFLFQNRKQCYGALDGAFGDELKRLAAAKGFKLLCWHDVGFRCMTNSKHPIIKASDLKGLKMRAPNSKSYISLFKTLGSDPVAIDLSEVYLALSQKLADGQDTPPANVRSLNLFEVQKYISKTNHILTTTSAFMNPAAFEKLSAQKKEWVLAAVKTASDYSRDYAQKDEATAYDDLVKKGMQLAPEIDLQSFRTACAPVVAQFPDLFPPNLVKLAQAAPA